MSGSSSTTPWRPSRSGSAWVNHLEAVLGSIEVGKTADLAVLDRDLFDRGAGAIGEARVVATFIDGDRRARDARARGLTAGVGGHGRMTMSIRRWTTVFRATARGDLYGCATEPIRGSGKERPSERRLDHVRQQPPRRACGRSPAQPDGLAGRQAEPSPAYLLRHREPQVRPRAGHRPRASRASRTTRTGADPPSALASSLERTTTSVSSDGGLRVSGAWQLRSAQVGGLVDVGQRPAVGIEGAPRPST